MKKKLALILSSLAVMTAGLAALPSPANAFVYAGSCNWSTDGAWHWSPAYSRWFYYQGHTPPGYRAYMTYSGLSNSYTQFQVWCGYMR